MTIPASPQYRFSILEKKCPTCSFSEEQVRLHHGECKRPEPDSLSLRQWMCCDDIVTSWISNSLAKDIADIIEYANDATELWTELEDRYNQTNGTKLYKIQKEINDLSQGVCYYTKMKKLWEELNNLSAKSQYSCQYICGAKESMHKVEHGSSIFSTDPRGKHREVRPNNLLMMESVSMNVFTPRNINLHIVESTSLNATAPRNDNFKTNYSTGNYPNRRPRPFCDYCKRPGHTKDKCFKLHGYSQNNNFSPKFNKDKRISANVNGAPVESMPAKNDGTTSQGCSDSNNMNSPLNLTKE
ncbi:uncharacterized protein LOC107760191 [Nicotiana tabacum]|uniref:Uncharacterized protein LOC107760191 n=2 Tax=Nicotiana TaxID=4085 RepID=A0A1S3X1J9_TOBAC|nr:PREDICTED: uncharacterized protein LOC104238838 [Nicotiana sylvestris]XP_016433696.1 PREDICTED: uncharacterized protein LOC107760191 [Nicotiana tabacum]